MSRKEYVLKYFEEQKAETNLRVNTDIEKYRKGDAAITVKDKNGNPVKNVKIVAKQTGHEFKYGANLFMLDEMETEEKNKIYRKKFKEAFNIATLPLYWSDIEPEKGKPRYDKSSPKIYRRPATDLCVEYCLENGIEPKVHCLNYENFTPDWIKKEDADTVKFYLEKRMRELSERYASVIPSWEVTNETLNNLNGMISYGASPFFREDDFVEWSFLTADKYFKNNRLIINDYQIFDCGDTGDYYKGNRSAYYMQIERLFANGITHLDSVGMQFHSFVPQEREKNLAEYRYNPERLFEVLDKYAQLGKKMQITEMTIPAYSGSEEDEYIQAEIMHNIYRIFFSHKAMEAIIYWNVPDGYAAFAPTGDMTSGENIYYGGFLRHDLSEKPAFKMIKDLFGKEWRTNTETETNEYGKAEFRGFYGDYDLTVAYDGKEIKKDISISEYKNNEVEICLI